MNYNKILEDLDLKLNIAEYEIDNMCDVSNFPLTKEKKQPQIAKIIPPPVGMALTCELL